MKENYRSKWKNLAWPAALFFPILLFGLILLVKIPYSLTQYFRSYSIGLFLAVLVLYYLSFRVPDRYRQLACLGLTLFLYALSLS